MAEILTKQPDGRYAIFSTVIDDFVVVNATLKKVAKHWKAAACREVQTRIDHELHRHGPSELRGRFDRCVKKARSTHEEEPVSLQAIGLRKPE